MPGGRKNLQRIQLGKETTAGTAVPCTTIWRGQGNMLDDQRKIEEITENVGIADGMDRTAVVQLMGAMELQAVPATFEQFQYLLAMTWNSAPTSGAADGTGSDKIYTTNVPTTTLPPPPGYTVRAGDDFEAEIMEYTVCKKFELAFKLGETVKMSASLFGRQVQKSTFTASLSVPAVEDIITGKGKVYLDDVSGAYGTTQVSAAILAGKITVEIQQTARFFMDGNLYYTLVNNTGHKITGALTYEHDTAVSGQGGAKEFFRNQVAKLLRIDFAGSAVATAGTTYSNKRLIIDLPLKFAKAGVIGEQNGSDVVEMNFRSRYNATAGNAGKFIVVSEVATLP